MSAKHPEPPDPKHQERIDRLRRLESCLPLGGAPDRCPDGARLLAILGDAYPARQPAARRRTMQRDLEILVRQERIEVVNAGSKPLRYRRRPAAPDEDPHVLQWILIQIRDLAAQAVPQRQFEQLWRRLLTNVEADAPRLDETRLRVIPDTLRLQPAALRPMVLEAVIQSLIQVRALEVLYHKPDGERRRSLLHPQALIQRGPLTYLFALKDDEDEPLRLYALHRMVRAQVRDDRPARAMPGFDLDRLIAEGRADFGSGELIELDIRVRGYLAEVLRDCPLAPDQRLADEPPDAEFELRVWATLPSTGQLLRWLLGAGDNLEVVGPPDMRRVVAAQTRKAAALYAGD